MMLLFLAGTVSGVGCASPGGRRSYFLLLLLSTSVTNLCPWAGPALAPWLPPSCLLPGQENSQDDVRKSNQDDSSEETHLLGHLVVAAVKELLALAKPLL